MNFKVTVLKDSSITEKGNRTAFVRISIDNGFMDNEIATGFTRVNKEVKAGESMNVRGGEVIVKKSTTPFLDKDGKEVYGDWVAVMPE